MDWMTPLLFIVHEQLVLNFSETMWSVRYIATTPKNMIVDAEVEAALPVASVGSALGSVTRSADVLGSSAPSENYQSLLFTGDVRELEYYAKVYFLHL